MSDKIRITEDNAPEYFSFEILTEKCDLSAFDCGIEEYNAYLQRGALQGQSEFLAVTWLLHDLQDNKYVAYMSVIADAIKIAKLAVSKTAKERYSGIGTNMLNMARHIACLTNGDRFACRFITVDADIENDVGVTAFYRKNGFLPNEAMNKKSCITINMRRDLFLYSPTHRLHSGGGCGPRLTLIFPLTNGISVI
jgi:hypothetical protein